MQIKRILVPIDFSRASLDALGYASDLALALDAKIVLLHVIEPTYRAASLDVDNVSANVSTLIEDQRRAAEERLAQIAAEMATTGPRLRTVTEIGNPAQLIVDSAGSEHADLIIMATRGRTGLAHMLMGSVTEKVVRTAECPVLTARSTAFSGW